MGRGSGPASQERRGKDGGVGMRPKAGWNDGKLLLTASRSPASGLRSAAGFTALGGPASQRGEPRAPWVGAGQGRPGGIV